ncbi:MAG TPA: hypothetical protein VFC31_13145 [Candidatus Limnocylindria bacterium]|nr:hypothetical protein [Candidatus Limnocylindria bacterium]
MVDALHEIHRVLRPGGLLIDARPDSRRLAAVDHLGGARPRTVGTVNTSRETLVDDHTSDRAIARVKREGLFRSLRRGGFTHHVAFAGLPELLAYLGDHRRLVKRARWSVPAGTRRRWRRDRFRIERPVRYELLESVPAKRQRPALMV